MEFKTKQIDNIEILEDIYSGFKGFDNTFSKNIIEIFNVVFNCIFYFVLLVEWNFLYNDPIELAVQKKQMSQYSDIIR